MERAHCKGFPKEMPDLGTALCLLDESVNHYIRVQILELLHGILCSQTVDQPIILHPCLDSWLKKKTNIHSF